MIAFLYLATGNFVWEFFTEHLWLVATERTYFQGWAILSYWAYQKYIVGPK